MDIYDKLIVAAILGCIGFAGYFGVLKVVHYFS